MCSKSADRCEEGIGRCDEEIAKFEIADCCLFVFSEWRRQSRRHAVMCATNPFLAHD